MTEKYSQKSSEIRSLTEKVIDCTRQSFQRFTFCNHREERQQIRSYLQTAIGLAFQGILLIFITEAIFSLILLFCKAFAQIYMSTHIGQAMVQSNSLVAIYLNEIENIQIFAISWKLITLTLLVGIGIGMIFQVFQLTKMFYFSRGFVDKHFFFTLPMAGLVTYLALDNYTLHWQIVFFASLIPAFCLSHFCFVLSYELFPELSTLLRPWFWPLLVWNILYQALLVFLISTCVSIAMLFLFLWLSKESGVWSYLPDVLCQFFYFLNAMTVLENILFVLKLCLRIYVIGVFTGMLMQLLGVLHHFESLKFRQRFLIAGSALSIVSFQFRHSMVGLESNAVTFAIIAVPAFCMAIGCVHIGYSLVVNISLFHHLSVKIQSRLQAINFVKVVKKSGPVDRKEED